MQRGTPKKGVIPIADLATAYIQIVPSFEGITQKLRSGLGEPAEQSGKESGSGFGKAFGIAAAAAVSAAAAGVTAIVKESVNLYSEYEQLVGGVETLFGTAYMTMEEFAQSIGRAGEDVSGAYEDMMNRQQTVMDNAANAYKTAGMSANEYMNTVNSFAASLISSLGEYEWQAAHYANEAVTDMADNAAKFGSDLESIQNAYQGFSKQNFTMLDNLDILGASAA